MLRTFLLETFAKHSIMYTQELGHADKSCRRSASLLSNAFCQGIGKRDISTA